MKRARSENNEHFRPRTELCLFPLDGENEVFRNWRDDMKKTCETGGVKKAHITPRCDMRVFFVTP